MKFLSVCSGIEAASVAWTPLGFEALAVSEIEKFPCAVLAHHYPTVPNLGDMTKFKEWPDYEPDILVGGTPCQSFSVAGLRKGLADSRGNLMLTYLAIADRYRPEWIVWENVPGVLSSGSGRDFGTFLGALGQIGYGWAYRVLDAQFFGVPQRRRRVFVVGHLGDWHRAAAVLFERHSLQGHPAPSREKGESPTYPVAPCLGASGRGFERAGDTRGNDAVVASFWNGEQIRQTLDAVLAKGQMMPEKNRFPAVLVPDTAHSLRAEGFDASEDGTGRGTPLISVLPFDETQITSKENASNPQYGDPSHPLQKSARPPTIAFDCKASSQNGFGVGDVGSTMRGVGHGGGHQAVAFQSSQSGIREVDAHATLDSTLRSMGHVGSHQNGGGHQAVAFAQNTRDEVREMNVVGAFASQPGMKQTSYIRNQMQVRRLTPRECERLQGFPDDYTLIPFTHGKPAADGPRYKALGNSMAVPVMRWIGERIQLVDWLHADN